MMTRRRLNGAQDGTVDTFLPPTLYKSFSLLPREGNSKPSVRVCVYIYIYSERERIRGGKREMFEEMNERVPFLPLARETRHEDVIGRASGY